MKAIFLSASVPVRERGDYFKNTDPYLIQLAVREFLMTTLGRRLIVWGGHPAITPMVWAACEDLGVEYSKAVVLYQSKFYTDKFPDENKKFENVIYTEKIEGDQVASLLQMRKKMVSSHDFSAAVFIGGMEGIRAEYELFSEYNPDAIIVPVGSPGGASKKLAQELDVNQEVIDSLDFSKLFHEKLNISPMDKRMSVESKQPHLRF